MYSLPVLIFVLIIFLAGKNINEKRTTTTTEKNSPTPTPTPEIFIPSKWAGDQQVLDIESSISKLEKDLEQVDLKELQLLPPVLDVEVRF